MSAQNYAGANTILTPGQISKKTLHSRIVLLFCKGDYSEPASTYLEQMTTILHVVHPPGSLYTIGRILDECKRGAPDLSGSARSAHRTHTTHKANLPLRALPLSGELCPAVRYRLSGWEVHFR